MPNNATRAGERSGPRETHFSCPANGLGINDTSDHCTGLHNTFGHNTRGILGSIRGASTVHVHSIRNHIRIRTGRRSTGQVHNKKARKKMGPELANRTQSEHRPAPAVP
jgi:hypothetical protein